MIFVHGVAELKICRAVHVEKFGACPNHEQLADFFFDGHFVEGLLRPLFAIVLEMNRQRLIFGFGGSGDHEDCGHQEKERRPGNGLDHREEDITRRVADCFALWQPLARLLRPDRRIREANSRQARAETRSSAVSRNCDGPAGRREWQRRGRFPP